MFNPANTAHFTLAIDGLEHDLQVIAFEGREALALAIRQETDALHRGDDLGEQDLPELLLH